MATKLGLFNAALQEVGDYNLTDTGDRVEAARVVVNVYDNVVKYCLSSGAWNFAMNTVKLDADTGISPNFGPTEVFAKPTNWLRTFGVSADDRFENPVIDYLDDQEYWAAESSPLYFRYTSNDTGTGLDLANWPVAFTRYVELELAHRILPRLSQNKGDKERIKRDLREAKRDALSQDAMNEAQPRFPPTSSWTRARGRGARRRDRGNTGSLTG